jgi:hypothetical protein
VLAAANQVLVDEFVLFAATQVFVAKICCPQ